MEGESQEDRRSRMDSVRETSDDAQSSGSVSDSDFSVCESSSPNSPNPGDGDAAERRTLNTSDPNNNTRTKPKKKRQRRTRFEEWQRRRLLGAYHANQLPSKMEVTSIANSTMLAVKTVRVWFQNRRCNDRRAAKTGGRSHGLPASLQPPLPPGAPPPHQMSGLLQHGPAAPYHTATNVLPAEWLQAGGAGRDYVLVEAANRRPIPLPLSVLSPTSTLPGNIVRVGSTDRAYLQQRTTEDVEQTTLLTPNSTQSLGLGTFGKHSSPTAVSYHHPASSSSLPETFSYTQFNKGPPMPTKLMPVCYSHRTDTALTAVASPKDNATSAHRHSQTGSERVSMDVQAPIRQTDRKPRPETPMSPVSPDVTVLPMPVLQNRDKWLNLLQSQDRSVQDYLDAFVNSFFKVAATSSGGEGKKSDQTIQGTPCKRGVAQQSTAVLHQVLPNRPSAHHGGQGGGQLDSDDEDLPGLEPIRNGRWLKPTRAGPPLCVN